MISPLFEGGHCTCRRTFLRRKDACNVIMTAGIASQEHRNGGEGARFWGERFDLLKKVGIWSLGEGFVNHILLSAKKAGRDSYLFLWGIVSLFFLCLFSAIGSRRTIPPEMRRFATPTSSIVIGFNPT